MFTNYEFTPKSGTLPISRIQEYLSPLSYVLLDPRKKSKSENIYMICTNKEIVDYYYKTIMKDINEDAPFSGLFNLYVGLLIFDEKSLEMSQIVTNENVPNIKRFTSWLINEIPGEIKAWDEGDGIGEEVLLSDKNRILSELYDD